MCMKAYTYIVGWRSLDLWYYGFRCSDDPGNDLWVKYFTSSKYVAEKRKEVGEPDVVRVHKVFSTKKEAQTHESKFLRRVKAKTSKRWLNRRYPEEGFFNKGHSEETRKKIGEKSKANWGSNYERMKALVTPSRPISEQHKRILSIKLKEFYALNPQVLTNRPPPTLEVLEKKANKMRQHWKSEKAQLHRESISKRHKNKAVSEETREKIRQAISAKTQICEHCGAIVSKITYTRFHGDRCKSIPGNLGFKHSEETLRKMREARARRKDSSK